MKKNKFLQSTLILIIGGFITRLMGFIIKIMYTRVLTTEGISLYSLVMPLNSLIVTIAGFAMPISISKIIAEGKIRSKKVLSQSIIILTILNIICMLLIIFTSDFISGYLLHEPRVKILIIASALAMPFMGLACVFKGYFYGKQKMLPNTISNIVEQSIRIIFIIFFLPTIINKSILLGVFSFILITVLTEIASSITFLILLPKNININLKDIKYDKDTSNYLFKTSLPLVSSKIIGNIGYFFEPIILSSTMLLIGYSKDYFILEYGIYNSYSISLLLLPSFFIQALCTSLIPEISKIKDNKLLLKRRIKQILNICLFIGIISTLFITIFRNTLLSIIYNTTLGSNYILSLSIFFPLYYLEAPLSSILQALGYGKYTFNTTLLGIIIKSITMFLTTLLHIGLYGLVISECINILFIVILNYIKLKKI